MDESVRQLLEDYERLLRHLAAGRKHLTRRGQDHCASYPACVSCAMLRKADEIADLIVVPHKPKEAVTLL